MNVESWLKQSADSLHEAGILTARLDSLVLLEDCLNLNRAQLLAHPELDLTERQLQMLTDQVDRRSKHEPLAYIRGHTEFYGRDFIVNKNVLEPRPESETMIDLLKTLALPEKPQIVDVGTGSGALAVTAQLELPHATVTALDIDPTCLEVARQNAEKYDLQLTLLESNLLKSYNGTADVLLCNLPYVPDDFEVNEAAGHEPKIALFGGWDGLDFYRQLFAQLKAQTTKYVLTESLPTSHDSLVEIARSYGYMLAKHDDFIQLFERTDAHT